MKDLIDYLEDVLEYLEYYNQMSPFPVYDTEYVDMVRGKLAEMKKSKKDELDELPVAACRYCGDLHLVQDEAGNEVCMRCGAVNEVYVYKDIFEWLQSVKHGKKLDATE